MGKHHRPGQSERRAPSRMQQGQTEFQPTHKQRNDHRDLRQMLERDALLDEIHLDEA